MSASLYRRSLYKVLTLVGLVTLSMAYTSAAHAQSMSTPALATPAPKTPGEMFKFLKDRESAAKENQSKIVKPDPATLWAEDLKKFESFRSQTNKFKVLRSIGGGGMDGGGGDSRSQEFFKVAIELKEQLKKFPSLVEKIDLEAFRDFILTTEVVFTHDDLLLNGSRKEAINYPLKRQIYINIGDWDQLLREPNLRAALVLHEFLGLMTIDDAGYELSSTILNSAGFTFPKNYSKVVAEKGSYLDSYDTLAAELVQTWDNGHGNRELTKQMSVSILQFFYGFYSVKFESEDDDQESLKTAYYLAIHLRDLLPYDIVEKAFIRLSDSAPITSTLMGWGVHIDLGMNHELVIAKDRHWGVQERFEDINFVQKLRGKNARAIGCQVSLPKASTPALPRIILRQLFAMALNCGGDYYYIDTNVNGAYPSDLEN